MPATAPPRDYIFVHDYWFDAAVWDRLASEVSAGGHRAHVWRLAEGPDQVSLEAWAESLAQQVAACADRPIVVGHGMAGLAISALGERQPEQIAALVYLAGYLPRDGESIAGLLGRDADSVFGRHADAGSDGRLRLPEDGIAESFFNACDSAARNGLRAHVIVDPQLPAEEPVRTTERRFGRIPRTYIECRRDRTVSLRLQRMLHSATPCPQVLYLDADHAPFFSAPEGLLEQILNVETTGF